MKTSCVSWWTEKSRIAPLYRDNHKQVKAKGRLDWSSKLNRRALNLKGPTIRHYPQNMAFFLKKGLLKGAALGVFVFLNLDASVANHCLKGSGHDNKELLLLCSLKYGYDMTLCASVSSIYSL